MSLRKGLKPLFIYLFLTIYGITTIFPFLWMVITTFKSKGAVFEFPPQLVPDLMFKPGMWDNYAKVLFEHHFMLYLWNSTFISLTASFGQLLTCSLAGFAFARMQFAGKHIIFSILIGTMMIPGEVTIIPEFLMFSKLGWLNTFAPLIIPSLLVGTFGTFLLKEFYSTVPAGLEEAAIIDGCSSFRVYRDIFLPLSGPPLATLFVIAFMNNWNDLLRPVLYTHSPALRTVSQGLMEFHSVYSTDWTLLMTASVIALLPIIVVYVFNQRYILDGMISSGMKG
ncbi:carbohydrate ABC transporter permease [Paenibacillus filicis]|uniref:Carbohydrate ABC transporter permease n=1 Tax=Paenibacillus gyeongsangnamensis TaxID=3388067 RepID=A0ABT4QGP1_9BACL|nr:carbohydrate ABC transporter permease [Paenibacillus filicis]MCZ8516057.1 carbohydrate ABC transporter permease [Paenibacillus filicis]